MTMKTVAAALIVRDNKILICQRTRHQTMPLKWEFPGGKIEPGEKPEQALVRELEEELGLTFPDSVLDKPSLTMADVEKAILDLIAKA